MANSEPRFAQVVWLDAWSDGVDDVTLDKVHEKHHPLEMQTRGWILLDDEIGISLFYERQGDMSSYRGRTFIPRGMIKSVDDFPAKRKPRVKRIAPEVGS
jgi:hypothetical protein